MQRIRGHFRKQRSAQGRAAGVVSDDARRLPGGRRPGNRVRPLPAAAGCDAKAVQRLGRGGSCRHDGPVCRRGAIYPVAISETVILLHPFGTYPGT